MLFAFVLPNLAGGGAEKAILKTGLALAERGHEVHVFLLERQVNYAADHRIRLHFVADKIRRGCWGKRSLALRLQRQVSCISPDLLVSTLPFADEVTRLTGLPNHWCRIANTLSREIDSLRLGPPLKAERRLRRYKALYGSRPLIAVSAGVASDLKNGLGLKSRVVTVPNPFDFDAIRSASREPLSQPQSRGYVLHVARFSSQKRHDLLLDAWAMVPGEVDLILLTEPTKELQAMISARGLSDRVKVAGFQSNPYPWMARARLLVQCSDYEGLPNVLIESLICGTPVVSTDCPSGPREILGETLPSALIPCGDASALASRIRDFLAQPPPLARVDLSAYGSDKTALAYEAIAREKR